MNLVYIFFYDMNVTVDEVVAQTGHGRATILKWFSHFRDVTVKVREWEPKLHSAVSNHLRIFFPWKAEVQAREFVGR